jgi:NAD(P)-dependent dehydrogenase (short-subunit alcohol dehydrogenase family)
MSERVSTPFDARSSATDVIAGIDLAGKRAIVTGGASGIGVETARALAAAGAEVTLAVRNTKAGERVAADINAGVDGQRARVSRLDLIDQSSIAAFVASWDGSLEILVTNAGVMALPELTLTPEGWEAQFATNHLGHFALACGLHPALRQAGSARIVSVSSTAHLRAPVDFEDIHFASRPYEPLLAYGQSKTANALFAVAASRRWSADGILANSVMPGAIPTGLQRHMDPEYLARARDRAGGTLELKTPQQGAATSVLLAASPLLDGVGGRYFEDCNEAAPAEPGSPALKGVAPYALDLDNAERLWQESLRLLA